MLWIRDVKKAVVSSMGRCTAEMITRGGVMERVRRPRISTAEKREDGRLGTRGDAASLLEWPRDTEHLRGHPQVVRATTALAAGCAASPLYVRRFDSNRLRRADRDL